jgi:glycosyltransferase involved in cell wall biosynthesis
LTFESDPYDQREKTINIEISKDDLETTWLVGLKSKIGLFLYKIGVVGLYFRTEQAIHVLRGDNSVPGNQKQEEKFDLIHFTLPQIMDNWKDSENHVVTVHDITHISHEQFHLSDNIRQAQKGFDLIKDIAPRVVSVSKSTFDQLVELKIVKKEKLKLLYEAIDHSKFHIIYDEQVISNRLRKYQLENTQYLLCLATSEPRKNLRNTAKAFLELIKIEGNEQLKLVIGGKPGWKSEPLPQHENILYTGYVEDRDLCTLYNGALAFCFISHHEGFGLPPLEAMRCKTIAVYGDNSAMRELIGEYGIPADPNSIKDMCEKMQSVVANIDLREKMEIQAYLYSLQFSIPTLGEQSQRFYNDILTEEK